MKIILLLLFILTYAFASLAQDKSISGVIFDSLTSRPIPGATIVLVGRGRTEIADEQGRFHIRNPTNLKNQMMVSAIGFQQKKINLDTCCAAYIIRLCARPTTLSDVVITAASSSPYKLLIETAIQMRGVSNSQEVLRMVPGLFIGQHQGGGKAEQIFIRGFDADHGTDIRIETDGIPVNMVSHAHGQGYSDSHFIIPETIKNASFNKGPYDADKGDLATAGHLEFHTTDEINTNVFKIEAGDYQTYRAVAIIQLLENKKRENPLSWYAASEYSFTNSYFDYPEHFKRFNLFTKINYALSRQSQLSLAASTFWSSWSASGQIPERAIDSGWVNYYGALDPDEGGVTSRTNLNLQLKTALKSGGTLKNQLYYSRYQFDLHSNFSFFLEDSVNGDEIRQQESRNLYGYNGNYICENYMGPFKLISELGLQLRMDATNNTAFEHTIDRYTLVKLGKLGNIQETGAGLYLKETLRISEKVHLNAGLRFDQFYYRYANKFGGDSSFPGIGVYKTKNNIFSPKLNLFYQANSKMELYFSIGKGFHTNDTRAVVAVNGFQTLPAAWASDLGLIYKPIRKVFTQVAVWYLYLDQEFVYGSDGGTIDFSGPTRRMGVDLSVRYQPAPYMFFDLDLNYAHGRSIDASKGQNFITLAPVWSSSAGLNIQNRTGWSACLRYRWLSQRPANETNSLICQAYFVNDFVFKYRISKFEYGLLVNNLFNVKWRETQFDTVTRLKGDQIPVDGISFTPGTKLSFKLGVSYFFSKL